MSSRRLLKAAEAIREVVSMAILTELRDPRVRDVTVTFVEVSADMRQAKVHVSIMGDDAKQQTSLRGLQNSAGFLQAKLQDRIDTRYTPRLQFILDQGVKRSIEVQRILNRVLPRPESEEATDEGATGDDALMEEIDEESTKSETAATSMDDETPTAGDESEPPAK